MSEHTSTICFGVGCQRHAICAFYQDVEGDDESRRIGTCETKPGVYPMFLQADVAPDELLVKMDEREYDVVLGMREAVRHMSPIDADKFLWRLADSIVPLATAIQAGA